MPTGMTPLTQRIARLPCTPSIAARNRLQGLLILPAMASLLIAGCSTNRTPSAASPGRLNDVLTVVVHSRAIPNWTEAVGTVRASQTAYIASQTSGNLLEVHVHDGNRVSAGQLLALIDDAMPRAAVEEASAVKASAEQALTGAAADYTLAASTQARYQALYDKKEISTQQFDEVKTRAQASQAARDLARAELSRATAAVAQAKVSLGYSRIEAPFAGLVTARQVDQGTYVSVGMPLFTMEATGSYRLDAQFNEADMGQIRVGGHGTVQIDAIGTTELEGRVTQIVPSADSASRTFLVKIALGPDSRLRSGLFGRARFPSGVRSALMAPQTAVIQRGQLQAVFVVDSGNFATLRYVIAGNPVGQEVEILSGLQDGECIVAAPGDRELAGKLIKPRP